MSNLVTQYVDLVMENWYAIYVKPRAEKKVQSMLLRKDIELYLPLKKSLHQWKTRKKWVETPVVSGYIFVHINKKERLNVLQTDFVIGFVRYLGKDAIIPDYQIDTLKCMLGQSEVDVEVDSRNYKVGQKVRVIAGPLIGLEGNLISLKNRKKMLIHIDQLNTNFMVEIPHFQLEKIKMAV